MKKLNKKLPKVIIVGIPNVGKSTLFNKLTSKKKAIVHREAGMTRDVIKEKVNYESKTYELIDTGGVFEEKDDYLLKEVKKRVLEEVKKSDLVLFLFDIKRDVLPIEEELFIDIKKTGKKIIIVLNKADSIKDNDKRFYYEKYKKEIVVVSAEHSLGIEELQEKIIENIDTKENLDKEDKNKIKILFTGKTNVGKSSLLNAILDEDRFIVSKSEHTTRDVIDEDVNIGGKTYTLIDSAGIRKIRKLKDSREKAGVIKTKKFIKKADVVVLLLSPDLGIKKQDLEIAREIEKNKKPLIIAVNKSDLFKDEREKISFEKLLREKLFFLYYAPVSFVSAKEKKGINKLFKKIEKTFSEFNKRVPTSELNEFFETIRAKISLIGEDGKPLNSKYITQVSTSPPKFLIFSKRSGYPSLSHYRFLEKEIRKRFGFTGVPIILIFKKG